MTSRNEVAAAMAEAITVGTGLRAVEYEDDRINPPCAIVIRGEYDPRLVLSGAVTAYPFKVRLVAPRTPVRASSVLLSDLSDVDGATSVIAAIQDGDLWPDDLVHYAQVTLVSAIGEYAPPGGEAAYLAVELDVEVVF